MVVAAAVRCRRLRAAGLAVLVTSAATAAATSCPSHSATDWSTTNLDSTISFVAHHRVDRDTSTLHLRLEAKSTGWLGFGFAEPTSGHMKGADMVTAAVFDGQVTVDDRHAVFAPTTYSLPSATDGFLGLTALFDVHNDWIVVAGSEANGVTWVWLTRPLATGDQQDRDVTGGPTRIVWAWGNTDVVTYHSTNRGVDIVTFFADVEPEPLLPAHDGVWNLRLSDYAIPAQTVTYVCQSFRLDTSQQRHIVALTTEGLSGFEHHAILHICKDNAYTQAHAIPQLCGAHTGSRGAAPNNGLGMSPLHHQSESGCSGMAFGWSKGMGAFVIPPEAGLLVGTGPGAIGTLILELHLDNPRHVTDATTPFGFHAMYVDTLRQHDAACLQIGDVIVHLGDTQGNLPKETSAVHRYATCPSVCTEDFKQPVTVFTNFPHMHNYGHKMYVEHYDSSGKYLGTAGKRIDFWDGSFQGLQSHRPYTIHPGDTLRTHCWYNTAAYSASDAITFGVGTANEMCVDFIFYFPAQYRGYNSNGEQERLAMCGNYNSKGKAATICGSLSQEPPGSFLLTGGQEDKGDLSFDDPLHFGEVNKQELQGSSVDVCEASINPHGLRVYSFVLLLASVVAAVALLRVALPNPPASCSMTKQCAV